MGRGLNAGSKKSKENARKRKGLLAVYWIKNPWRYPITQLTSWKL